MGHTAAASLSTSLPSISSMKLLSGEVVLPPHCLCVLGYLPAEGRMSHTPTASRKALHFPAFSKATTSKGVQAFALCISHGCLISFSVDINSSNSSDNFLKKALATKCSATYTCNILIYTSHHHQVVRKSTANTSSPHSCTHGSITTADHPTPCWCQRLLTSVRPTQCWMRGELCTTPQLRGSDLSHVPQQNPKFSCCMEHPDQSPSYASLNPAFPLPFW